MVSRRSRYLRIAGLVCASGVWAWVLLSANAARLAQTSWHKALAAEQHLAARNWQGDDEEYISLISLAAKAADCQPDNVEYRHWLNVYRWRSVSRGTDPNTNTLVIPEEAMAAVTRIVEELNKARLLCPTYGATYCVVGQLERFILNDPNGADRIRKGFELTPCDPTACFISGLLDAEEQQIDLSFEKLSRAVQLDGRFFSDVVDVFINRVGRPDLAIAIAGDDVGRLSRVANALADVGEHKDIAEETQNKVIELLKKTCSGPEPSAKVLASLAGIYRNKEDHEAAIEYYRRALLLEYGQVQWRFELARLLAEADRISEAIHEARVCLRLQPQFSAAERLIEQLSVLPGAMKE